jgi:hypothetical protein
MGLRGSAVSAATGVLLLGLAIFGNPHAYLRHAGQRLILLWEDVSGSQPADPTAVADVQALTLQTADLQQQVLQLRQQLEMSHSAAGRMQRQTFAQGERALIPVPTALPADDPSFPNQKAVDLGAPAIPFHPSAPSAAPAETARTVEVQPEPISAPLSASPPSSATSPVTGASRKPHVDVATTLQKGTPPRSQNLVLTRLRQWSQELFRTSIWQASRPASLPRRGRPYDSNVAPNDLGGGGG